MNNADAAKKPFWKKWWVWVLIVLLFIGISGQGNKTKQAESPTPSKTLEVKPAFDIPSLIGKDLDEVKAVLGKPQEEEKGPNQQQIDVGIKEKDTLFRKNGIDLLVTSNIFDNKIMDYFLSSDDPSGQTKDTARLLKLANAKLDDRRYKIEFIKVMNDPSSFTGIKITPN